MRIWVCALAKNEHKYINEWVKHYIDMKVSHIVIYDNDDIDEAKNIADFIDNRYKKYVEIINIRGYHEKNLQARIYTDFYNKYNKQFDWCCFFDIDEFLTGVSNIQLLLSDIKLFRAKQIRVKWRLFGDDDIIERDTTKPVLNAFNKVIKKSLSRDLKRKCELHNQAKCIVKGGLRCVYFNSVHYISDMTMKLPTELLPSGKECYGKVAILDNYDNETIYLNHYMTKSLSEFIEQKLNRTDAVFDERKLKLDYYWRINTKTNAKLEYLKERGIDYEL